MNEHGDFTISKDGHVITITPVGDWNIETTHRFCSEFRAVVETIIPNAWILVADLSEGGLGTPDIWDELQNLTQWSIDHNKSHEIVIYSLSIQKDMLEKMQESLAVKSYFCKSKIEAQKQLELIVSNLH